jgi:hypothetical protein
VGKFRRDLNWESKHDLILNKLYTLYNEGVEPEFAHLLQLGYKGYPDPKFEDGDEEWTPDFLAVSDNADAQIIDVKAFEEVKREYDSEEDIKDKIRKSISDLTRYRNITGSLIERYLENYGDVQFFPKNIEVVALVPENIYESYQDVIDSAVENSNLTLWIFEENDEERIKLELGGHSVEELNKKLDGSSNPGGVEVYPEGADLIRFTRQTDERKIKYHFASRMLSYCVRESKIGFSFEEVDLAMVDYFRTPMLGHLPKEERTQVWKDCMKTLLSRLDLVSKRQDHTDSYEWEKPGAIKQPRYRNNILDDVKSQLGLDNG